MVAEDTTYGLAGRFPIVRCRRCGLVYTNPRPTRSASAAFYPATYRPHVDHHEKTNPLGVLARRLAFASSSPELLGRLYNSLAYRAFRAAPHARPRVLDVGCGVGDYLRVWRALGWEVEGLEPDEQAAKIAERRLGAPIHQAFVEEVQLAPQCYDLVTCCHTLEHFHAPIQALDNIKSALRVGGWLLVMVPNFAATSRLLLGKRWLGLEVPRHLYHFEPNTLRALLESAGYTDIYVGGSAHPGVLLQHIARALGGRIEPKSVRALAMALALANWPLAALRRADFLWATAQRAANRAEDRHRVREHPLSAHG